MSRGAALAVLALCACSGKKDQADDKQPAPAPPADGAIADWTTACASALAAKQTPVRKLTAIIESCRPCGDWAPLLAWSTPAAAGGPSEQAILDAMERCHAYCSADAKMQFTTALPDARENGSNRPWRVLGDKCKAAVSAVPDERFMSAPFFALDRIARAAAADPKLAPLLATLELPLPAVSISGVGFELPAAAVMKPEPPRVQVTVSQRELRVGLLPIAKLGKDGVQVDLGATAYPGDLVPAAKLRGALDALGGQRVLVIAPSALPAVRLVEVVRAAGTRELVLAVAARGAPPGWSLPGIVPVTLAAGSGKAQYTVDDRVDATIETLKTARPAADVTVTIAPAAKVADLAKLLGALSFHGTTRVAIDKARP